MSTAFARHVPRWALAGLLLTLASSPARAQLGRLKKLGAEAVKEAAKDKLAGKKDSASAPGDKASGGTAVAARAAEGKEDLTLSDDRVAMVVASLLPLVAEAEKRQELNRISRAHSEKRKASNTCVEAAAKAYNPMTAGPSMTDKRSAEINRMSSAMSKAQDRLNAAVSRNDLRAQVYLQDTVDVLTQRASILTMNGNCSMDFTPAPILEAQVAQHSRGVTTSNPDAGMYSPSDAVKSQLTPRLFGIIRERVALWALKQLDPTLKVGKEGIFTAEEEAALAANATDIKKLTPYFKGGGLYWSSWEDLGRW